MDVDSSSQEIHFFVCRQCWSYIASFEAFRGISYGRLAIFQYANVRFHYPGSSRWIHARTIVTDVYCRHCHAFLGREYARRPTVYNQLRHYRFLFDLKRLLFWDGNCLVFPDLVI